jgi:hypothetical protein
MRKSDYPKVLRRGVAVMVILLLLLLLLFGAFAPVAVTHISLPAWWKGCPRGCGRGVKREKDEKKNIGVMPFVGIGFYGDSRSGRRD